MVAEGRSLGAKQQFPRCIGGGLRSFALREGLRTATKGEYA